MSKYLLSVVVPTRNRQAHAAQTVKDLVEQRNSRPIEILVVDNSDDRDTLPEKLTKYIQSGEITFIGSKDTPLSMAANWNRAVDAATGDWISVIGDDDLLDLDVCNLIQSLLKVKPGMDALYWARVSFPWPDRQKMHRDDFRFAYKVSITNHLIPWTSQNAVAMFNWAGGGRTPGIGLSIYHGALSRALIKKIKENFGSPLFQNANLDYEIGLKGALLAAEGVHCTRPLSIMGSSENSNSVGVNELQLLRKRIEAFERDAGEAIDSVTLDNFPFPSHLGLTATVGRTHRWFVEKFGVKLTNPDAWKANFALACAQDCEGEFEEENFKVKVDGYRKALMEWDGGKHLHRFKPVYRDPLNTKTLQFCGLNQNYLFIDGRVADHKTPMDVLRFLRRFIVPIELVGNPEYNKLPEVVKN